MATVTTPWGTASAIESVTVSQRSGERRFSAIVELLETGTGERIVRFAYSTGGTARRGPVSLRSRDLDRLRKALERAPQLKEALLRDD